MHVARPALGLFLALAIGTACTVSTTHGSGEVVRRRVDVRAGFTRVEVDSAFQAKIRVGASQPTVTLEVDADLADRLRAGVEGDTLSIGLRPGTPVSEATLVANVAVPELRAVVGNGASVVEIVGAAGDRLEAGVSGASALTLAQTSVDALRLIVAGASTVSGDGRADTLDVTADGASTVDLLRVTSQDAVVRADGASTITVDVANTLEAHADGASTVRYAGGPQNVAHYTSGASTVGPVEG